MPPTLGELLDDPIYAGYLRKNPRLNANVFHGSPWRIIARRKADVPGSTWALKDMPTYVDAYRRVMKMLEDIQWEDLSIISRRVMFKPPAQFEWNTSRFEWCARCRRPSLFRFARNHPALKGALVLTDDEPFRCYYCGIRRVAIPTHKPRLK